MDHPQIASDFEMNKNNVGAPIGHNFFTDGSIGQAPTVIFYVEFNADYTELKTASIAINIPLDVTNSALFAPVLKGKPRIINLGEVGLEINKDIAEGEAELEFSKQFLTVQAPKSGTLHIEVPISIAIKRDSPTFLEKELTKSDGPKK